MSQHTKQIGIIINDLSLTYGDKKVFDCLNFKIEAGQCVGLLGPSGVGKSSLLKIIAGLIEPTSGTVIGTDGSSIKQKIAYMGQQDLLFPWLSVGQNVCLGAKLRHEKVDKQKVASLLQKVGLLDVVDKYPSALSGGMRQRVAIARTLYEDKPIVLMDEPFSALDALTRLKMQELTVELLKDKSVFLITHDPLEALRLCNVILVMKNTPAKLPTKLHTKLHTELHSELHTKFTAEFTAELMKPIYPKGCPPRAIDDPDLIASEIELMKLLRAS